MDKPGEKLCTTTVQYDSGIGSYSYHQCGKKAKYEVTYNDSVKKERKTVNMCGIHKRALEQNAARVKRVTGFDSNVEIKEI